MSFLFVGGQDVESKISNVLKFKDCVFDILEMFKWQIQPAFTCSKLTKKCTRAKCEICSKLTIKTPELLLTFDIFHTFF